MEDDKKKLQVVLAEWFESGIPENIKKRKISIPDNIPKKVAFVLCGVRRAGKTYTLYEFAKRMRERSYLYNVIYLNLEDIRLHPITPSLLLSLPEVIYENFDFKKNLPLWFLFDEIQYLDGWEKVIRNYLDRNLGYVILTGSSSEVSPDGIATSMRGRTLTHFVYPLFFKEFLEFKNFEIPQNLKIMTSRKKSLLLKLCKEYLEFGGFPEIVLSENEKFKAQMLRELYRTIFFRDIVERFSIRNLEVMEIFMKILTEQFSSLFSVSKIYNFLKNTLGIKVTKNTLQEYLSYIKSAFLMFEVEIFSYKLKDRLQYPRKLYLIDTGIANAVNIKFTENFGRLLENAVFLELMKIGKEIFYWKSKDGEEVDFVIVENFKPTTLIQVCWEIGKESLIREEKALIKCMNEFSINSGKIITWDFKGEKKINDKNILYIPFWEWCLKEEKL